MSQQLTIPFEREIIERIKTRLDSEIKKDKEKEGSLIHSPLIQIHKKLKS